MNNMRAKDKNKYTQDNNEKESKRDTGFVVMRMPSQKPTSTF